MRNYLLISVALFAIVAVGSANEDVCKVPNCLKCFADDINQCQKCDTGYFIDSANQCKNCITHCDRCETAKTCITCSPSYTLEKSVLEDTCVVSACGVEHCTDCQKTDATKCAACEPTYYLKADDLKCYKCSASCTNCVETDVKCTSCPDYFKLNTETHVCEPEICKVDNCDKCVAGDTSKCLHCKTAFFVNSANECKPCLSHCDACQTSTSCDVCAQDYKLKKGIPADKCIVDKCEVKDCTTCSETDAKICDTCAERFYLKGDDKQCYKCSDNCATCIESDVKCTTCHDTFVLNPDTHLCEPSKCLVSNCHECEENDREKCKTCNQGFFAEGTSACKKCSENCLECVENEAKCTKCQTNYALNPANNQCEVSTCQVTDCGTCQKTNATVCISCKNEFFLNSGKCNACSAGCQVCDSSEVCKTCKEAFSLEPTSQKCEACPANCKNCANKNNCTLCETKHGVNKTNGMCDPCPEGCLNCNVSATCDLCENDLVFDSSLVKCTQRSSSKAWLWILLILIIVGGLVFVYIKIIKPRMQKVRPSTAYHGLLDDGQSAAHGMSLVERA